MEVEFGTKGCPMRCAPLLSLVLALGCRDVATQEGELAGGGSEDSAHGGDSGLDADADDGVWANVDGAPIHWPPSGEGSAVAVDVEHWSYQVFVGAGTEMLLVLDLAEAPGGFDCRPQRDGFADANVTLELHGADATPIIHTAFEDDGGRCRVDVTTATGAGGRLEGTFSATLVAQGQPDIEVTDGRFALAVQL